MNSREFIPISPLCTPSFVLTPGVPPPQTPLQAPWLQATCAHVCGCAFVWGVWVCVGLCMVVWLGLHVGGCVTSCLFLRAGVRLCVGVCEDVGATRPHTHTNPLQTVPAAHWWLSGNVKLGLIWGSVVHCDVFVLVCCAFCMLGNVHLMFLEVLDTHLVKVQGGGYFFWRRLS